MIPKGEQWSEIAAASGGDLAVTPYGVVLSAMARARRSGVLRLVRKPVNKQIFLVEGRPVECRSNLAHETFGRFLLSEGKLSPEDQRACLADSLSREVPLGEVLIERELLSPQEVYKFLQKNLARRLLDGFTWSKGRFEFDETADDPDGTVQINAPQLILTGLVKLTPQAEIDAGVSRFRKEAVALDPRPAFRDASLRFTGRSERVVQALQSEPLTLEKLGVVTELGSEEVDRVIYALAVLGWILPAGEAALDEADRGTVSAKPLPGPAGAEVQAAEPEQDQALLLRQTKIVEAYLSYRRKDSFDFFELEEGCRPAEIEKAYLAAAETYAPWSLKESGVSDFAEQGQLLFLRAAQAYAELKNSESRNALIYRRKVLRDEEASRKKASFSIDTDLLDSEEQFKRGLALAQKGELNKALELLEFAFDCDPQSALYRAELAYHRDQFEAHRYRKQSLADLREAIRIDARCGIAHYYLGLILGDEGKLGEAEESLRKSIKLMAPDRRPIEALKELSKKKR